MHNPPRGTILDSAKLATCGDRNRAYGDPIPQLGLAGHLKAVCRVAQREHSNRSVSNAEWEALDMVITKLSRAIVGPVVTRDTYVDGAAYFAIAGEAALSYTNLDDQSHDQS